MFNRVAIVVTKSDKLRLLNDHPSVFGDGDLHDVRPLDNHRFILLQGKRATTAGQELHTDFIQSYEQCISLLDGVQ
jgi:hypothetical protein